MIYFSECNDNIEGRIQDGFLGEPFCIRGHRFDTKVIINLIS